MSAVPKSQRMSVEAYLARELDSDVKHEYLGGYVYAMAGGRNVHNLIASNVLGLFHACLRGSGCQAYNSDTKIRVRLPTHVRMYYPDVSVVCDPNPPDDTFQDQPVVVVEVLSRGTRRNDQSEKREAYLTIPSLHAYLLIEQEFPMVTAYVRTDQGFVPSNYDNLKDVVRIPELTAVLPLAEIYEGVEFTSESDDKGGT